MPERMQTGDELIDTAMVIDIDAVEGGVEAYGSTSEKTGYLATSSSTTLIGNGSINTTPSHHRCRPAMILA